MSDEQRNVAVIYADLDRSALGLRSRVADELAGRPVLTRTLDRLGRCRNLDGVIVFCPEAQVPQIQGLMPEKMGSDPIYRVESEKMGSDPIYEVVGLREAVPVSSRVGQRKWGLDCWRGGIREATVFDEQSFTAEMVLSLREREVYSVLSVAAEAVLVDPGLTDRLLEHHREHGGAMRFTFTQAPPGLTGCAYRLDLLHELVQANVSAGDLLRYDPESPHGDYILQECNCRVPVEWTHVRGRVIADTKQSFDQISGIFAAEGPLVDSWDAQRVVEELRRLADEDPAWPEEVEIWLTNTEQTPNIGPEQDCDLNHQNGSKSVLFGGKSVLFPGEIGGNPGIFGEIRVFFRVFRGFSAWSELVWLVESARAAGALAVGIEADGEGFSEDVADELAGAGVDVVAVRVDANTGEVYERMKGVLEILNPKSEVRNPKQFSNAQNLNAPNEEKTEGKMPSAREEKTEGWKPSARGEKTEGRMPSARGEFEELKGRLGRIAGRWRAAGGPILVPQMVKCDLTFGEMEAFYEHWLGVAGAAVIVGWNDYAGQIEDRSVMDMRPGERFACGALRRRMVVRGDGVVLQCGQDLWGLWPVGDLRTQSVEDVWRGALRGLRELHRLGRWDDNSLCARCKEWHR